MYDSNEHCGLKQPLKAVSSAAFLLSMVKTEVYLGSSNSLWSAEGCHWKDCNHENQINKLIYWTKMFRNQMQPLFHCEEKNVFLS